MAITKEVLDELLKGAKGLTIFTGLTALSNS
jgi:hypothetical protein